MAANATAGVVQLANPSAPAWTPLERVLSQQLPGWLVRLAWEDEHHPVLIDVLPVRVAIRLNLHVGGFPALLSAPRDRAPRMASIPI